MQGQGNLNKTKHSIESKRSSFRTKFALNPIDETLSKSSMINATCDKRVAKELLGLLNKNYHEPQIKKHQEISKEEIEIYLKRIIEEPKNIELSHCDTQIRKCLKKLILHGKCIDKYRKEIWMVASGARIKMLKNEDYYAILKSDIISYPTTFLDSIELDLKRTFPDKPSYDKNDPYIQKMRNVLHCYAKRNPSIGYCQGLNFIVAKLLLVVPKEEEAFWLLSMIIESIIPTDYFTSMEGVLVDQEIFRDLANYKYSDLKRKFKELQIDSSLFSLQWFVCLYTSTFPDTLLFPLWDLLILDGCRILFKAGIFFLNKLRSGIKSAQEFHEVFLQIDEKSKQLGSHDFHEFLLQIQNTYINKELLKFDRELYRIHVRKNLKKMEEKKIYQPHIQMQKEPKNCKPEWPICVDFLDRTDKTRAKSLFLFRVHNIPDHIIPNHFNSDDKDTPQKSKPITKYNTTSATRLANVGFINHQNIHNSPFVSSNITRSPTLSSFFNSENGLGNSIDIQNNIHMNNNSETCKVQDKIVVGRHYHTCRESKKELELNKAKGTNFVEDCIFKSIEKACKLPYQTNILHRKTNIPTNHISQSVINTRRSIASNISQPTTILNGTRVLNLAGSFQDVLKRVPFQIIDSYVDAPNIQKGHILANNNNTNNNSMGINIDTNSSYNKSDSRRYLETSNSNSNDIDIDYNERDDEKLYEYDSDIDDIEDNEEEEGYDYDDNDNDNDNDNDSHDHDRHRHHYKIRLNNEADIHDDSNNIKEIESDEIIGEDIHNNQNNQHNHYSSNILSSSSSKKSKILSIEDDINNNNNNNTHNNNNDDDEYDDDNEDEDEDNDDDHTNIGGINGCSNNEGNNTNNNNNDDYETITIKRKPHKKTKNTKLAKSVFDILHEVHDNSKNNLYNRYMEFNRSFLNQNVTK